MRNRREFLGAITFVTVGSAGCTTAGVDPPGEGPLKEEQTPDEGGRTPEECESPGLSDDVTLLGDFEDELDGWRTDGESELSRVTEDEVPAGVASGEHALAVKVRGDEAPTIENEERVRRADFTNNPYLQLHVHAVDVRTDTDLLFRFRLHHAASCGDGGGGNGSTDSNPNVEESEDIVVPQLRPRRIQWDASGLPEDALATAKRLEIAWTPVDNAPSDGPPEEAEDIDFRQLVVIDDVRLSAGEPMSDAERLQQKRSDLNREHGMMVDRIIEVRNETVERGTFVYADDYRADYFVEVLDDGRIRYTLDGETFILENESR